MPTNIHTTTTPHSSNIEKKEQFKFRSKTEDLFRGIQAVQSAISIRSTLPILANIMFEVSERGVRLSATDLEVGIRSLVKADVVATGAMTIPAKILSEFLRTVEDDRELDIEVSDNKKIELRVGKDHLSLTGLPKEDYPVLPEFNEKKAVILSRQVVKEMIKKTAFAASTDETRYVLNGIHLMTEEGKATVVATDGRRLAYIQRAIQDEKLNVKVIIPTKAVQELNRLVSEDRFLHEDKLQVSFSENQVSFKAGQTVVLSRLIEGHFPNFEQVIPKTHEIQLRIERSPFLASVTRAAVGTLERGGSIRLSLAKGALKVQGAAQGRVEVESELSINYEGPDFDIAFNPLYLIDVLKALDHKEVLLELTSPLNPGVIRSSRDDAYRYVMMPMKI